MNKLGIFILLFLGIAGLYLEQQPQLVSGFPWIISIIDYLLFLFLITEAVVNFIKTPFKSGYIRSHLASVIFLGVYSFFFIINKLNLFFNPDTTAGLNFFFIIIRNILLILKMYGRIRKFTGYLNSIASKPAQTVVLSFFIVILVGTLLLTLPFMSNSGHILFIDALFTATSAVCVTGLAVVDTAVHYTIWGKVTIMLLIQIGGLGIMLLSSFMMLVLKRTVSLKDRSVLSFMLDEKDIVSIRKSVKRIIFLTFSMEAAGALLLLPVFLRMKLNPFSAIFYSLFHAVSAFCNAGFSLFSDSLLSFQGDVYMNLIISLLIILGGISFIVIIDTASGIKRIFSGGKAMLSINTKVVLKVSGALILVSTLFIYKLEHETMFLSMGLGRQYLSAFFQAVTLRTAGFNTIDFGTLRNSTLMFMIGVMFIGGASGSTAGGIKVNTLGAIWAYIHSFRRERDEILIYKHQLPYAKIQQAFIVISFAVLSIFIVSFILMLTEDAAPLNLLFETVSAFATVGLSTGITPLLSLTGKICIICLMFIGRIGPLTLLTASSGREKKSRITYPEASLLIG
ncbi:MAG: TrkH family potassium uptake protein [Spirochaetales bacterium]|nr:TrkH family potassium uptake protein [Spirochaetales bacterium]